MARSSGTRAATSLAALLAGSSCADAVAPTSRATAVMFNIRIRFLSVVGAASRPFSIQQPDGPRQPILAHDQIGFHDTREASRRGDAERRKHGHRKVHADERSTFK